ncbi:MAG TPA: phosphatase PAP2 family protein [Acidimicrobiales bacterium]|nr:phosphatase PAP2 family protein [Acidimicrobiales bacterium]
MSDVDTTTAGRLVRRPADAWAAAAGLVVLALGLVAVRDGEVGGLERDAFEAVNGLPGWLYPIMWPFQQVGAVLVGPLVAIVAALFRRWRLALAVLAATVAKLVLERVVKAMVSRERPGATIGADADLRGDVPSGGESFVSGHAVLIAALACLVAPYLPRGWRPLAWVLVGLVMVGRVYVGAHNPLDVICGAGLGVAIGSCLNLGFGVPDDEHLPIP